MILSLKSAAVAEAAVAVANATMEYSGPVVDAVGLAAKNAASSAVDAGSAAIEYVRSIDPIEERLLFGHIFPNIYWGRKYYFPWVA